jgi:nucleotide-binding universal stress UspA family protein
MAEVTTAARAVSLARILVGVDFSPESDTAILHAAELARQRGARLLLAHVMALPADLLGDSSYDPLFRAQQSSVDLGTEHRNQATDLLLAIEARCQAIGVETEVVLVDDNPSDGLARIADELGADLLVVGTHGRTGLRRFLLGSVAERTVRLARVNTMVARGPVVEGKMYERVLVATDFSASADVALTSAVALAPPTASIEVVHLWQTPMMPTGAPIDPMRDEIERRVAERGERLMQGQNRARVRFVALEGSAAEGIRRHAEESGCDLIVIGSHGRRGVRRWLLGSVAEAVVRHASCAVLVVHPPEPDGAA